MQPSLSTRAPDLGPDRSREQELEATLKQQRLDAENLRLEVKIREEMLKKVRQEAERNRLERAIREVEQSSLQMEQELSQRMAGKSVVSPADLRSNQGEQLKGEKRPMTKEEEKIQYLEKRLFELGRGHSFKSRDVGVVGRTNRAAVVGKGG